MSNKNDNNENNVIKDNLFKSNSFIDASCKYYAQDYKNCSKFKSRLNQLYENGVTTDCSIFENLLENCAQYAENYDKNAFEAIYNYEKNALIKRVEASKNNDVWEKRVQPPSDWNAKLPDWAQQRINESMWFKQYKENVNQTKN